MKKKSLIIKIIIILVSLALVAIVLKLSPNYIVDKYANKTKLIINNSNVTNVLKADVLVEDGVVYISKADIDNFFDGTICYDEKYDQIITTSSTKVAALPLNNKTITVNGSSVNIYATAIKKDDTLTEDQEKGLQEDVQELINKFNKKVEETVKVKTDELMSV